MKSKKGMLAGKKLLITAGPTEEPIDPVRFISNRSTGRMGYLLASSAHQEGAIVTLISGPTHLSPLQEIKEYISVRTALEMREEVLKRIKACDVLIMAAAPSDYRPRHYSAKKIKGKKKTASIELFPNPDILKEVGEKKRKKMVVVGFAAETDNLINNARRKLKEKNLDFIIANRIDINGAGFGTATTEVKIITKEKTEILDGISKEELSSIILKKLGGEG
ncbi:MAG: Coenzyme A biosynthesis bifunctional protein CoaBC [Firmicutes bacterium]|nr:Coenzyme A biosynthesis bifunctional protein CoaBC [Bacillota bacterium]